jgi:peroxiredoxin
MLLAAGCAASSPAPARAPSSAQTVPAVALQTLDGQPSDLPSLLSGRVGLVSLWATWCEACRDELDALSRLADRAGPRGATVVAVAVGEKRAQVEAFVHEHPLRAVALVDEDFHLADAIGARRVPTTIVIDHDGHIRYVGGALDESALAALRAALDRRMAAR